MEMNTLLIAIIAFLLGILVSVFLYVRLLKKFVDQKAAHSAKKSTENQELTPQEKAKEEAEKISRNEKIKIASESQCQNHEDRSGHGLCAICMESFCEECLLESEHLHFCRDHYRLFTENNWEIIDTIRTNPDKAEESMYLYDFKGHLWKTEQLPTIVTTHYQINTESDCIESQVSLLGPQEKQDQLFQEIKSFRKPS